MRSAQRIWLNRCVIRKVVLPLRIHRAIDSETEQKIVQAIETVLQNRTTLLITHRLHTIRSSDKVLVLKHGEIVAEGCHEELLLTSEDYRRIFGKHFALPEAIIW